jgi:hypothetical protein
LPARLAISRGASPILLKVHGPRISLTFDLNVEHPDADHKKVTAASSTSWKDFPSNASPTQVGADIRNLAFVVASITDTR